MRKDILFGIGGFLAGAAVGAFAGIKIWKKRNDEDIFEDVFYDYDPVEEVVNFTDEKNNNLNVGYYTYKMNDKPSLEEVVNKVSAAEDADAAGSVRICDEKDFFEENGYEKMTATYFVEDEILAGWNNNLEEIDASELDPIVLSTILGKAPLKESMYFRDDGEQKDICIMVSDGSYDDAYEELIAKEVEEASKES